MRRSLLVVSVVVLVAGVVVSLAAGSESASGRWVVRDLGTLGGPESRALGVNELGQVVGWADTATRQAKVYDRPIRHAFLWENGRMRDLGSLRADCNRIEAITLNNRGQLIGNCRTVIAEPRYAEGTVRSSGFLWENGTLRALGTLGGKSSYVRAINEGGAVIGWADTKAKDASGDLVEHAFLWEDGAMRDLTPRSRLLPSFAAAINATGQVVGAWWARSRLNGPRAFLWDEPGTVLLPGFRSYESTAYGINDRGQVVGSISTKAGTRAAVWDDGGPRILGVLPGGGGDPSFSLARAVNERGQVLGESTDADLFDVFLWDDGTMSGLGLYTDEPYALNERGQIVGSGPAGAVLITASRTGKALTTTRLGALPGGKDSGAVALNERNQIVGWAETKSGQQHAVLWTKTG